MLGYYLMTLDKQQTQVVAQVKCWHNELHVILLAWVVHRTAGKEYTSCQERKELVLWQILLRQSPAFVHTEIVQQIYPLTLIGYSQAEQRDTAAPFSLADIHRIVIFKHPANVPHKEILDQ